MTVGVGLNEMKQLNVATARPAVGAAPSASRGPALEARPWRRLPDLSPPALTARAGQSMASVSCALVTTKALLSSGWVSGKPARMGMDKRYGSGCALIQPARMVTNKQ